MRRSRFSSTLSSLSLLLLLLLLPSLIVVVNVTMMLMMTTAIDGPGSFRCQRRRAGAAIVVPSAIVVVAVVVAAAAHDVCVEILVQIAVVAAVHAVAMPVVVSRSCIVSAWTTIRPRRDPEVIQPVVVDRVLDAVLAANTIQIDVQEIRAVVRLPCFGSTCHEHLFPPHPVVPAAAAAVAVSAATPEQGCRRVRRGVEQITEAGRSTTNAAAAADAPDRDVCMDRWRRSVQHHLGR